MVNAMRFIPCLPSRRCLGHMPDLPGARMPFGSSASLMVWCIFIRALSFQLYVPAMASM